MLRIPWRSLTTLGFAAVATCTASAGPSPASGATADALSPSGPASLRKSWLGSVTTMQHGPRVLTGWHVDVGPGGQSGSVRLRLFDHNRGPGRTLGVSDWVALPAEPGRHTFDTRIAVPAGRSFATGLDQQTGDHAVIDAHPSATEHAVDIWRPALGDGQEPGEHQAGREVQVFPVLEPDMDEDGYGDQTQDVNDLAIRILRVRRGKSGLNVRAALVNRGSRTVHRPGLEMSARRDVRIRAAGPAPRSGRAVRLALPAIRAGGRAVTTFRLSGLLRGTLRAEAFQEGIDPTPADAIRRVNLGRRR